MQKINIENKELCSGNQNLVTELSTSGFWYLWIQYKLSYGIANVGLVLITCDTSKYCLIYALVCEKISREKLIREEDY